MRLRLLFLAPVIFTFLFIACESGDDTEDEYSSIKQSYIYELDNYYVQTGKTYFPLNDAEYIEVYISDKPNFETEKVGLLTVGNDLHFKTNNLASHIEMAKIYARGKGANIIVLIDTQSSFTMTAIGPTGKVVHTFELLRKKQENM